jgi:hypothetical protein
LQKDLKRKEEIIEEKEKKIESMEHQLLEKNLMILNQEKKIQVF